MQIDKQYKTTFPKTDMDTKESRIRALTKLYYSKPEIQKILLEFSKDRETIPRYFEGFGKRPDIIQYPSDVMGLVKKGATSFHASEELWNNPLELSSESTAKDMSALRKSWDLLIDIDSPYLDCSKIAARLIIAALEQHGVKNYGIKFSGSKGFHILISGTAFPETFQEEETKKMFPEWPRAISEFLMYYIRRDYNQEAGEILTDFDSIKTRTNLSKEDLREVYCTVSNRPAKKGLIVTFECPICGLQIKRRNIKLTKRRLKCLNSDCAGVFSVINEEPYYYCEYTKDLDNSELSLSSDKNPELFEEVKGVSAEKIAALDLVLVAPRHLFRMPYSLHEKTSLASIVLTKDQLDSFSPKDADPLKVKILEFQPENEPGEASRLLSAALEWKKTQERQEEILTQSSSSSKYPKNKGNKQYPEVSLVGLTENHFPKPIKKLLKGLEEGRKRGLFILLTFLKSLNYSPQELNEKIREWNKKNDPPLKEGYVKSQIDWHLKQKKKILPPNYANKSFYEDLGLLDSKPKTKNPLADVLSELRKSRY
jgi:predicted RNA-binding Zn-ribbon protein involved in translation (DUF1610 family)